MIRTISLPEELIEIWEQSEKSKLVQFTLEALKRYRELKEDYAWVCCTMHADLESLDYIIEMIYFDYGYHWARARKGVFEKIVINKELATTYLSQAVDRHERRASELLCK